MSAKATSDAGPEGILSQVEDLVKSREEAEKESMTARIRLEMMEEEVGKVRFVFLFLLVPLPLVLLSSLSSISKLISFFGSCDTDLYTHERDGKLQGRAREAQERACWDAIGGRWADGRAGQGARGEAENGEGPTAYEWSTCECLRSLKRRDVAAQTS